MIPIQLKSENRLEAKPCSRLVPTCSVPSYFDLPFSAAIDEQPHAAELTPVGRISGAFATCSLRGLTAGGGLLLCNLRASHSYAAICESSPVQSNGGERGDNGQQELRQTDECGWQKGMVIRLMSRPSPH